MHEQSRSDIGADLAARRAEEQRAVKEAGGGESEGFELAEQELIEHASHGDQHTHDADPPRRRPGVDEEEALDADRYGEADEEHKPD